MRTQSHSHTLLLVTLLLLSHHAHTETIQLATPPSQALPTTQATPQQSGTSDLMASMQSTFGQAQDQTANLGSLFDMGGFFSQPVSTTTSTAGNNVIEGSGNQMQGYNNKISGESNQLIGANTNILGDLNKAFGLSNTIFGSQNTITRGSNNKIKGSNNTL